VVFPTGITSGNKWSQQKARHWRCYISVTNDIKIAMQDYRVYRVPRSTPPSTLRGTVKWVPAKGRWCSAAGKVTSGLAESNGSLPPGGWLSLSHLRADCLYTVSVYRQSARRWLKSSTRLRSDQFRAQLSVTSMGSLYLCYRVGTHYSCSRAVSTGIDEPCGRASTRFV